MSVKLIKNGLLLVTKIIYNITSCG